MQKLETTFVFFLYALSLKIIEDNTSHFLTQLNIAADWGCPTKVAIILAYWEIFGVSKFGLIVWSTGHHNLSDFLQNLPCLLKAAVKLPHSTFNKLWKQINPFATGDAYMRQFSHSL